MQTRQLHARSGARRSDHRGLDPFHFCDKLTGIAADQGWSMTPMRVRALLSSSDNERAVVVLEDVAQRLQFAFSADLHEARRLERALDGAECTCNPIYDFIESCLSALQAAMTRVVLDDAGTLGIHAVIWVQQADVSLAIPCYPPDALGLALRTNVPIDATPAALAHGKAAHNHR